MPKRATALSVRPSGQGYKVHLTETCDEETPHLITHVETTPGTQQDSDVTASIHADLAQADLLPSTHFVDEGYTDAQLLVESQQKYDLDLLGPVARNGSSGTTPLCWGKPLQIRALTSHSSP